MAVNGSFSEAQIEEVQRVSAESPSHFLVSAGSTGVLSGAGPYVIADADIASGDLVLLTQIVPAGTPANVNTITLTVQDGVSFTLTAGSSCADANFNYVILRPFA